MAKKQKRNIPQSSRVSPAPSSTSTFTGRPATSGLRPSASTDFNPDYTYAKQDLKRVGVMAASFIGALIVLYFLLPLFIK